MPNKPICCNCETPTDDYIKILFFRGITLCYTCWFLYAQRLRCDSCSRKSGKFCRVSDAVICERCMDRIQASFEERNKVKPVDANKLLQEVSQWGDEDEDDDEENCFWCY